MGVKAGVAVLVVVEEAGLVRFKSAAKPNPNPDSNGALFIEKTQNNGFSCPSLP
jgi:hypothetical protein